ncbi:MAG TPA: tRNA-uridine aminocarboxypropyltransferase [Spirochaetia bacterium]|nr:tRNA-uridine aminocarboxypropyltransferase [Spirochaetales bacterium]HRY79604.1 tRNA-uridine aminocarboxypropyltransferase [Spirochaetia bacterium]
MFREVCPACRRPLPVCLCPDEPPMETRTRIVLLTHPKEWKRQRSGTGRLTSLHLRNCEIVPGLRFDEHPRIRSLLEDPEGYPVLLYPGPGAWNLSEREFPAKALEGRRLTVFLVDATWACSRAVLRESPGLSRLPRVMFTPREPSRWVIKRQPRPECLSTLEAVHELLTALDAAGLDEYPDRTRLLEAFRRMQEIQVECARTRGRARFRGYDRVDRLLEAEGEAGEPAVDLPELRGVHR